MIDYLGLGPLSHEAVLQASLRESENKLSEIFLILTNFGSGTPSLRNGEIARSGPDIQQGLAIDHILGSEELCFQGLESLVLK